MTSSHHIFKLEMVFSKAATPELFNCVIDHVLNKTLLAHPFGIDFAGVLSDVDFADDVASVCKNLTDIKTTQETLASAAERLGLNVNWTKTKILPMDKTPGSPLTTIEAWSRC